MVLVTLATMFVKIRQTKTVNLMKINAMETLTGLKSSLLLGTKDNNTISAEVDSLLALLKKSQPAPIQ
ncbi:histidine triad protein D [Streptococcus pneumoniae]|nr:histidine triad protein D [Streptococcus pneumoniae]